MPTLFCSGREVWQEILRSARRGARVHAAISYIGQGTSKLLRLRRQDILLVDMSLQAVRQGLTDPREIAKFVRRGVQVFW
jgi:hypothetical protein